MKTSIILLSSSSFQQGSGGVRTSIYTQSNFELSVDQGANWNSSSKFVIQIKITSGNTRCSRSNKRAASWSGLFLSSSSSARESKYFPNDIYDQALSSGMCTLGNGGHCSLYIFPNPPSSKSHLAPQLSAVNTAPIPCLISLMLA